MKVIDDEKDVNELSLKKFSEDNGRFFWDAGGKEELADIPRCASNICVAYNDRTN
jgi:hypothetical protein